MDKKQFFQSLVSTKKESSDQELQAFDAIRELFHALKVDLGDTKLKSEFELLEQEVLFHVWMFEKICNDSEIDQKNEAHIHGPLIVIFLLDEVLFVNKTYSFLSGLGSIDIKNRAKENTLYSTIYDGENLTDAEEAISRLKAGKGYKQLELTMRHSGQKISWNSYGGVGGSLEIRSGRVLNNLNNQQKERELFYRGSLMNTARLVENMYQICRHGILSEEDELRLIWVQEFLSMFDFLWNHSEFFMEIADIPHIQEKKISGYYNTVYAQFLKYSYRDDEKTKDIISLGYETWPKPGEREESLAGVFPFYKTKNRPVAQVCWKRYVYPFHSAPEDTQVFGIGILVEKIYTTNPLSRFFQYIFHKNTSQS